MIKFERRIVNIVDIVEKTLEEHKPLALYLVLEDIDKTKLYILKNSHLSKLLDYIITIDSIVDYISNSNKTIQLYS